jgi:hypothetical protein
MSVAAPDFSLIHLLIGAKAADLIAAANRDKKASTKAA